LEFPGDRLTMGVTMGTVLMAFYLPVFVPREPSL
jgi:hypothetical protein